MKNIDKYVLRVSATSSCNLNCTYCNPVKSKENMEDQDLVELIRATVNAGVRRISWTGGEPTIRKNILGIISDAKDLGIEKQSMTTNGIVLAKKAQEFKDAGIDRVNISLDTLDKDEFNKITGVNGFDAVMESIKKAMEVFDKVKLNCLITKDNIDQMKEFVEFAQGFDKDIIIRFLELVPCENDYAKDKNLFMEKFVSVEEMQAELEKLGATTPYDLTGNVPKSKYYKIADKKGVFGVNPNHSANYACDKEKCPKLRVSPNGHVSNCTTNLEFCENVKNTSQEEKNEIMKKLVKQKQERDYTGFMHKQKYYNFWRFGIKPANFSDKKDILE